jgi:hypothetical protein
MRERVETRARERRQHTPHYDAEADGSEHILAKAQSHHRADPVDQVGEVLVEI